MEFLINKVLGVKPLVSFIMKDYAISLTNNTCVTYFEYLIIMQNTCVISLEQFIIMQRKVVNESGLSVSRQDRRPFHDLKNKKRLCRMLS